MQEYPYTSPIILTDAIFTAYNDGLLTGSNLKQIGYWLAEEAVSRDLDTFLLPTVVTGTYPYSPSLLLDNAYVNQIYVVRYLDSLDRIYYTASGTYNYFTRLGDREYGVLDMVMVGAGCGTCGGAYPYRVQVVYNAGLSSGTSYRPNVLLALTQATSLFINEMQGWGNEGVGNIGITRFSNQNYSEQRMAMINTVYGNSAKSQFIHKQLDSLRKRRYVGI